MIAVVLALCSAMCSGVSDFCAGRAAADRSAAAVVLIMSFVGCLGLGGLLFIITGSWSVEAAGWGALSGITVSVGGVLLYRALSIGPMNVMSPVAAVATPMVPLLIDLTRGTDFGVARSSGFVLAIVAAVAITSRRVLPAGSTVTLKAFLLTIVAGSLMGLSIVCLGLTPVESGLVPLFASRMIAVLLTFAIWFSAFRRRTSRETPPGTRGDTKRMTRRGLILPIVAGVLSLGGNIALISALRFGDLSVVSAITALYPLGTIIPAAILLRESLSPLQTIGIVLALASVALLSLPSA